MPPELDAALGTILAKGIEYHQRGELSLAEAAYCEVLESEPEQADALHLLGVIAHQMGDSRTAVERIRRSLEIAPDSVQALNNLGNVRADREEWDAAGDCYRQVLKIRPDNAAVHRSLGHVLSELGRMAEARGSYERAIELEPAEGATYVDLSNVLEKLGHLDEALTICTQGHRADPESTVVLSQLGKLLRKMDRLEEARNAYDGWLSVTPDHPVALHLRAACGTDEPPPRASDDYVQTTFDLTAGTFEATLARLNYRVPQSIAETLRRRIDGTAAAPEILDLGCGTGLCGIAVRDLAGRLEGVDLSSEMLRVAREKEIYDQLYRNELCNFLSLCNGDYDVIVAGDTFIYLGDLAETVSGVAGALRGGGLFAFSVELLQGSTSGREFRLSPSGRYLHDRNYISGLLDGSGFEILDVTPLTLREEDGGPVQGLLVVAQGQAPGAASTSASRTSACARPNES